MNIFNIKFPVVYCSDTCNWTKLIGKELTVLKVPSSAVTAIAKNFYVVVKKNQYNCKIYVEDNEGHQYFVYHMEGWYFKPYQDPIPF